MGLHESDEFEALFHEHFDAVLGYAARRADLDVAKDVAAQTFLTAWRRRADIPDRALPWLLGVARNALADHRRSQRRRANLETRITTRLRPVGSADPADDAAERDVVLGAFAQLRGAERELLMLVAWDGLSVDDASIVLNCSPATCAVRLSRARRRFADRLERAERPHLANLRTTDPLEVR